MKIKVCGLKEIVNIKQIDACSIDYMGLIFYEKSPRYVDQTLPFYSSHMKRVGVFVNSSKAEIMEKREQFHLDCIQLHGNESPDFCREIKENHCIVIKAFQIHKEFNFTDLEMYEKVCDYFLFDTKSDQYGGSGKKFDWNILQHYKGQLPFFLSGGIRPEDVDQIKNIKHKKLHALDLNSGFEKQIGIKDAEQIKEFCSKLKMEKQEKYSVDENGYYGEFGGAFIPELLRNNIEELQANYLRIIQSEQFQKEYQDLLDNYVGRPTPLTKAKHLSEKYGANIYLKREDLNHTGAHKINNTIGQILLARHMGKKRIIAETGAGQHGVATATVCALFDMECVVYMGALDVARQAPNVARMKMLGAKVMPAKSGNQTLKDAVNEALRDWIAHPDSFYLIGSVVGPHPYPDMVTRLQAVISKEIRQQLKEETGNENPDYVIACVGGGSNAAGAFYHYLQEEEVQLIAVEASGKGIDTDETAATITLGNEGFLHGSKTLLMQDQHGQITEPYSISAGLDYPGVGPLHAHLAKSGRVDFIHANDDEALQAAFLLSKKEGIIPALESSHALAALEKISLKEEDVVVLNLSGRGDKDMETYMRYLDL